MATIKKPEANPVVAAILCLILALGHLIINGQQRKWLFILLTSIVLGMITCGLMSLPMLILSILEAYQTAERLQKGEELDENEYTFGLLYKIISIIDKSAVYKGS
ncbi:MAG: hypothetical protein KIS92_22120 [Planctomycetota bacterium]|nr:hypothetical protein [Planctomycetota bacterium]